MGRVPGNLMKGSFWWRGILRLINNFKGISKADFGKGAQYYSGMIYGMVMC
jgi:hypothetical protein